ncbi:glycoside hydrolase family 114 protein [Myriangium duriaei CBS 260.36]|uniref:alpha-galactosidase n=1 Tax=Myriangium duriaei CBS 260.36 TaxID=1168546 RepID=A0A9P4MLZ0_9PEZI|nr:glycoside hydrolase family 114 protein [Myriangium duriaei CBS 260.36]
MFTRKPKVPAEPKFAGEDSSLEGPAPAPRRGLSRKLKWIIAAVILVILLGVGLGVGLGLGLNSGNDDDDNNSGGNNNGTVPPYPQPTGNITDRVFWQPAAGTSWQIVLLNPITVASDATQTDPDVEVFDIDLFTNSQDTINKLHSLGKKVVCYFSAGSYEPGRPDSPQFQAADLGKELEGWPGEKWLKLDSANVRSIMSARIKLASGMGCDAIDPDNVDGYSNKNGLGLTEDDSINFMQFLSSEAGRYNMSCGLKNAGDIIPDVLNVTHFSVNEQCAQYGECTTFAPFIQDKKPVFHIEYPDGSGKALAASTVSKFCSNSGDSANSTDFSTVMKNMNLDGWVEYCNGTITSTPTNTTSSGKTTSS